ncbi:STAS domain-containing protein [Pusillimonas sp. CC-YST705]|uniref:Anti-sigma factor antagonist n=1 Tax=Mesopusillimonas faecipullorum TaxID=2755040 RepID=A0ABS8CBP9_9BURK|nr:STAS domain-containing protein [Mesopusillimonas faecipullorum]MCB5363457.1 STAS domain-containing protein [Mesopusillimonas faecipullorum]
MSFSVVHESWGPSQHRLSLHGRLDTSTRPQLEPLVGELASQENVFLVFDCEQLDYVASAGLRVFFMAYKYAEQHGGRIVFSGLQPTVRVVFEVSGFLKFLEVVDSLAKAKALAAA